MDIRSEKATTCAELEEALSADIQFERVVHLHEIDPVAGMRVEYDLLSNRYGRVDVEWIFYSHRLARCGDRAFAVMTIGVKGELREIIFDVTSFYRQ